MHFKTCAYEHPFLSDQLHKHSLSEVSILQFFESVHLLSYQLAFTSVFYLLIDLYSQPDTSPTQTSFNLYLPSTLQLFYHACLAF